MSDSSSAARLSEATYTITVKDSVNDSITIVIPVIFSTDISFTNTLNNVTCRGNGSIILTNVSGTSPLVYAWSNGGTTFADSGLSVGTYSVMVSDSCGDTTTASFTVAQTSDLSVSASVVSNVSCYNESNGAAAVSISAGSPPFIYQWSDANSQSTTTATGLSAGTYTVSASDSCGSTATCNVIITEPFAFNVNIASVNNIFCSGDNSGSASASLTVPLFEDFPADTVVQHFFVPPGVTTITLTIAGAKGGGFLGLGGNGANFIGICSVIPGQVLSVVVGQQGGNVGAGGGGGGASWVYDSTVVLYNPSGTAGLIAVAAGGGGEGSSQSGGLGGDYVGGSGGINLVTNATTIGTDLGTTGGTGGNGGNAYVVGAGGGGWLSNGENAGGSGRGNGGNDEANHFYIPSRGLGGFGGGSGGGCGAMGGSGQCSGGGGGGYNGGGAGLGGGGGGSFFVDTLPKVSDSGIGNGFVRIEYTITGYDSTFTYSWSNGETTINATGLAPEPIPSRLLIVVDVRLLHQLQLLSP